MRGEEYEEFEESEEEGYEEEEGWPRYARKRPPPKNGIKVKLSGTTWWGQRWLEALERMSRDYANRLERGRSYARTGRTHDLVIKPGEVSARVTGSRRTPYRVTLRLARLDDTTWDKAIAAMASQARFAATLLAGEMPKAVDEAFHAAGASLFPSRKGDLSTDCTCPDWANPCKHVAATHYVLGAALDKDPFLLFELRGRTREQVLEALRAARARERSAPPAPEAVRVEHEVPVIALRRLSARSYDTWREPPPTLHLKLQRPEAPGALLRQLGKPPGWSESASPEELLGPLVHAASERALRLAHAGAEGGQPAAPPQAGSPARGKRRGGA